MFDKDGYGVKLIWKCIFKLGEKISTSEWSEFINSKLEESKLGEDIIKYNRYRHIIDRLCEEGYYINYFNEQMKYNCEKDVF